MRFRSIEMKLMRWFGVFGRTLLESKIFRIECFIFPLSRLGDFPEGFRDMWMRVR